MTTAISFGKQGVKVRDGFIEAIVTQPRTWNPPFLGPSSVVGVGLGSVLYFDNLPSGRGVMLTVCVCRSETLSKVKNAVP